MGVPFVGLVRNASLNSPISFAREAYFLRNHLDSRSNSTDAFTTQLGKEFFNWPEFFSSGDVFVDFMDRSL